VTDPTGTPEPAREARLGAAIRRIVIGVVEKHPGRPDAAVLALTYARLLEEPAFRAEVFAALLALEEDGRR
jgi:hypothetical protein